MTFLNRLIAATLLLASHSIAQADPGGGRLGHFDPATDLFIAQFDSKTDVDDVHSMAAVATVLAHPDFAGVRYHAVAGAYGMQDGLYVPAPRVFGPAFGDHRSDAHAERDAALDRVTALVVDTLKGGGSVWVAEAGQSDFTADWLQRVAGQGLDTRSVNIVQHSDWNEEVTTPEKLDAVRRLASYHRIPDGNATGNGTPGFNSADPSDWPSAEADPVVGVLWTEARAVGNRFNGVDGRYLNEAIQAGGMDFSDTVETCWIFGYDHLEDAGAFFDTFLAPAGEAR